MPDYLFFRLDHNEIPDLKQKIKTLLHNSKEAVIFDALIQNIHHSILNNVLMRWDSYFTQNNISKNIALFMLQLLNQLLLFFSQQIGLINIEIEHKKFIVSCYFHQQCLSLKQQFLHNKKKYSDQQCQDMLQEIIMIMPLLSVNISLDDQHDIFKLRWQLCLHLKKIDELAQSILHKEQWQNLIYFLKNEIDRNDYTQMPYLLDALNLMIHLLEPTENIKKRKLTMLKGYLYTSIDAHDLAFQEYDKIASPNHLSDEENILLAEAYLHAPYFQSHSHIEERGKLHAQHAASQGNQEASHFLTKRFDHETYADSDMKKDNTIEVKLPCYFSQPAKQRRKKNLQNAQYHKNEKIKARIKSEEYSYYAKWGLFFALTGIGFIAALVLLRMAKQHRQQEQMHQKLEVTNRANAWLDLGNSATKENSLEYKSYTRAR